ncbi:MAG: PAS domain-containing protein [Candidatus Sumerlaeaceae bacterium]|nr:PAS domain-containing protein [Candidatus Sumerlaeaceae bacterium]
MTKLAATQRIQVKCQRAFRDAMSQRSYLSAVCQSIVDEWPYRLALMTEPVYPPGGRAGLLASAGFEQAGIALDDFLTPPTECGRGVTFQAYETLQTVVAQPLAGHPLYAGWDDRLTRLSLHSALAAPMFSQGVLAGILTVYAGDAQAFSSADTDEFRSLAAEVAACALALQRTEEISDVEESLYAETDFAAVILNTVDAVIVRLDPQGRIQTANKRAAELAGTSDLAARGLAAANFVARGFESAFADLLQEALRTGRSAPHVIGATDASGQVRLIEWRVTVQRDEWGGVEYLVAAGLDVTSQRRMEAALRERERYLDALDRIATLLLPVTSNIPYEEFLEIVGEAVAAHRAFYVMTRLDRQGDLRVSDYAEWRADGCPSLREHFAEDSCEDSPSRPWCRMLMRGDSVCCVAGLASNAESVLLNALNTQSLIILPILPDGRFTGFVGVDNLLEARPWSPAQLEFLRAASNNLTEVLKRQRAVFQREALQRLARRLTAPLTPHAIGVVVAEECRNLFLHDALALGMLNRTGDIMTGIYEEDTPDSAGAPVEAAPTDFPVIDRSTGQCCWRGRSLLVNRPDEPETVPFIPFGERQRFSRSLMFVPVRWQGKSIGSLTVQSYTPNRYDDTDLRLLESVADHLGGSLERARVEDRLRRVTLNLTQAQKIARFGSWEVDKRTGEWWWSDEVYRLFGYEPGEVTPSRDLLLSHIYADDRKRVQGALRDTLTGRQSHDIRCRAVWRDGSVRHLHILSGELMRDEHGAGEVLVGTVHDVTAQVEAEESLRRSERLLAKAQAMAHLGHWEVDFKARRVTWSDELFRILGLDPATVEPSIQAFYDSIHPDDVPRVREAARRGRTGGGTFDVEYRVVRPDGSIRHVSSVAEFAWDGDGRAIRATGTTLDVTELKVVEQALRQSEQLLVSAQRMARMAHWEFDVESEAAEASEEFFVIAGLKPFSVRLTPEFLLSIIHEEDRDRVEVAVRSALAGDAVFNEEYRVVRPDSEIRYVHAHAEPIRRSDGQVHRLVGFVQDITERKIAEEALRRSEQTLAKAQALAHLGHWDYDFASQIAVCSDEMYRIFGLEPRSVPFSNDLFLSCVHPDDRALVEERSRQVFDQMTDYEVEHRIVRPDGEIRYVHSHAQIQRDAQGQPVRAIGTTLDVTERKRIEEQLRESERRYRAVVEAQTELVCRTKPDATLTFVNEAYCRYYGKKREELLGSSFLAYVPDEDLPVIAHAMEDAIRRGGVVTSVHQAVTPSGEVRWQQWTIVPIILPTGEVIEMQCVGHDTTNQRLAERALEDRERLYALAAEVARVGVWQMNLGDGEVRADPALARLLGFEPGQIGTAMDDWLRLVAAQHRSEFMSALMTLRSGQCDSLTTRVTMTHRDGTLRRMQVGMRLRRDEDGIPQSIIGAVADITEQCRAEIPGDEFNRLSRESADPTRR